DAGRLVGTKKDDNAERVTFTLDPQRNGTAPGHVVVTDASGRQTSLDFGLGGQLVRVRDGGGRVVNFGYDSKSQFTRLVGPGLETYRYTYDALGNLTGVQDSLNLQTSFSYEPAHNRLASFTDARGNGLKYAYDPHGNLTKITYPDNTYESFVP